ncbi:MAG: hypothetical protein H9Q65_05030 [Spiroplasma ixodetis]|nr:hypothetical protein [Spiroplasma ixodetis]MBP1527313.1 hypothetical protein [Spiroplasma ixodetis]MBP1528588.1 hypothetical protein [Spiroplasma ixodetis]
MNKKEPKLDAFKNWKKDFELKPKQTIDHSSINETEKLENSYNNNQNNLEIIQSGNREKKIYTTFYLSKNNVEKLKKIAKIKNTSQSQVISDLINFIKI